MEHVRRWHGVLGVGLVVGVGYAAVPAGVFSDVLFTVLGLALLGAGATRLRAGVLPDRTPWSLVTIGLACFAVRPALNLLPVGAETARAVMVVLAYALIPLGSLRFIRARTGGRDRDGLLDSLTVCAALAVLLWQTITGPRLSELSGSDRVMQAAFPMIAALAISLAARLLFSDGYKQAPVVMLFASSVVTGISSAATVVTGRANGAPPGLIDTGWLVAYALVAAALWHPRAPEVTTAAGDATSRLPYGRLLLLGAAMIAVPGVQVADGLTGADAVPVLGGVVVTVTVFWRVVGLVRDREAARHQAMGQTRQQTVVAELGRRALEGVALEQLFDEVRAAVRATLDVAHVDLQVGPVGAPDDVRWPAALRVEFGPSQRRHGVLLVDSDAAREFTPAERTFVTTIGNLLAGAIERRRGEEWMRHQAMHDGLTGLANRTLLADRLEWALARAARLGVAAGVLFIDLDGFKSVNDTYGHRAGDDLLGQVARRLEACVRAEDTVARIAGDEFVVLCERLDQTTATTIAQRVVTSLSEPFRLDTAVDSHLISISASVGLAFSRDDTGADDLLRQADDAMYAAKSGGKSRYVVA